tara:strand:- start:544 stop:1368 length:825 start_codon:yes stop_codon:yes gene_type:complete
MSEEKPKQADNSGGKPGFGGKPRYGGKPPQKGDKKQHGGRPQRGPPLSPAQQRRRAAEERISNWKPKTELGRKVVAGEITTIQEALATGLPLREPPIIDLLVPDMLEEVIDIHMVQRMSDSGRRVRFAVTTIVGNGNGVVGLGRVSGKLVRPTITKALDRAKLNIIEIRRGSGSWECSTAVPNSLPFEVSGRTGSTRVTIKPAPPGVGLVTNQVGQIMLKLAGVEDAWSFTKGQTQTIYNFANAMFKALEKTSTTKLLPGQDDFHNMIKGVKQE